MAKRSKSISPEEQKVRQREMELREMKKGIDNGSIPADPTRSFKVGENVKFGAHKNVVVTDVLFDGLAYDLHYDWMGQKYGQPERKVGDLLVPWMEVFPLTAYSKGEVLREKDDVQIRYYNNDIDSLLHKVYYAGVDLRPDYQRDLVWTMEQKLSLLDSIFTNVEIGKFTFIVHDFREDKKFHYEILDGKQRLSTIMEFYEDRFTWRGRKFSELSLEDAHHFTGFPVIQGEVGQITEQQIYKLFLKMNTTGTPVSKEHLDKIKSLII